MNPLFQMMDNKNIGNMAGLISQFNQFKRSYNGDPQKAVQELLNSGRITQAQYDAAVQQAKALQQMLGM